MLDQLTIDTFEPLLGSSFWALSGTHKIELRLERAAKVMESEAARLKRNPFSLIFLGPGSIFLEQKIYRVTHESMTEPLDIFLVPIGREGGGYLYEAVFA